MIIGNRASSKTTQAHAIAQRICIQPTDLDRIHWQVRVALARAEPFAKAMGVRRAPCVLAKYRDTIARAIADIKQHREQAAAAAPASSPPAEPPRAGIRRVMLPNPADFINTAAAAREDVAAFCCMAAREARNGRDRSGVEDETARPMAGWPVPAR